MWYRKFGSSISSAILPPRMYNRLANRTVATLCLSPTWPHALRSVSRRPMPFEAVARGHSWSQNTPTLGAPTLGAAMSNRSSAIEHNTARPSGEPIDTCIGQPSVRRHRRAPKSHAVPAWGGKEKLAFVWRCRDRTSIDVAGGDMHSKVLQGRVKCDGAQVFSRGRGTQRIRESGVSEHRLKARAQTATSPDSWRAHRYPEPACRDPAATPKAYRRISGRLAIINDMKLRPCASVSLQPSSRSPMLLRTGSAHVVSMDRLTDSGGARRCWNGRTAAAAAAGHEAKTSPVPRHAG